MRLWITLALWIMAILFPLAWLGYVFPQSKAFLDRLMAPEWLHVVMHVLIFAGMVILLQSVQARRGRRFSNQALLGIVILVGVLQEFFQIAGGPAWFYPAAAIRRSLYDLGIDLLGGLAGIVIVSGNLWQKLIR